MKRGLVIGLIILVLCFAVRQWAGAGDFDDKIPYEDGMVAYDEDLKHNPNIRFFAEKAQAEAEWQISRGFDTYSGGSGGVELYNTFVPGDLIIIQQNTK